MENKSSVPPRNHRSPIIRVGNVTAQVVFGATIGGFLYWFALLAVLEIEISVLHTDLPFGIDVLLLPMLPPLALGALLRYSLPRLGAASTALMVGCVVVGAGFSLLLLTLEIPAG
ncbi:hypothetical protein ACFYT3_11830 [Nocardia amikacinitolerans]|uniref:hypothetical protein n=1 Tax=Nocardia amikacinitolerans TaxID=756689 RepID=UPI0036C3099D